MSHPNKVHLFALTIGPQFSEREWDVFLSDLPYQERIRILKYKYWQDRQRTLLGSRLVRWVLRKFTEVQHVNIARNPHGRPYLANAPHWEGDFNLSHSGEWVVVALTNQGHVGIDVEKIDCIDENVMAYAMSDAERNLLNERSNIDKVHLFYELWTMKEAIFKTGLFPDATPASLDTVALLGIRGDINAQYLYIDKNHPISICSDQGQFDVKLTVLNRNQLI